MFAQLQVVMDETMIKKHDVPFYGCRIIMYAWKNCPVSCGTLFLDARYCNVSEALTQGKSVAKDLNLEIVATCKPKEMTLKQFAKFRNKYLKEQG